MKRAVDEVTEIYVSAEVKRLMSDIDGKCKIIRNLLDNGKDGVTITYTLPVFYSKVGNRRAKISID